MEELIDTHAHLFYEQLASDLPAVVARAHEAGVTGMIAVGTTAESSQQCVALTSNHSSIWATVGVHPNEIMKVQEGERDRVIALLASPRVVGLGETGLDRHWDDTPFAIQEEWFAWHLELGRQRNLPVVIHTRDCEEDMLRRCCVMCSIATGRFAE